MDATLKAKWVEALRSGKYRKSIGRLKVVTVKDGAFFCPFGVLLDVYDSSRWKTKLIGEVHTVYSYDGDFMAPSRRMMKELGITDRDMKHLVVISSMSDLAKKNYNEVADYIEKNM